MKSSLGLIEVSSIPKGIAILDNIIKKVEVDVLKARSICPGKYMILVGGNTSCIRMAVDAANKLGQRFIIKSNVINNLNSQVLSAIKGNIKPQNINALGIIETKNAISSILIADMVWDASEVEIIKIKLGNGVGGKGILAFTGDIASVKNAMEYYKYKKEVHKAIIDQEIITSPNITTINSI
ncbi:BMC domain-containing protein [Maledivibacter halophilus]|uniref:Carboxysome shell and ethanolamine utilization microcompartment protein CcmL/EutN n=1 Tax=Maledivibacter halophilus TaxID=36842 RepID=A0A1T5MVN5_9FIRM|nr:BMC domain-containing protein [Maledivibacter halophilus]SKC91918.1 Carboxysome shell and ethanolamine utilization microcompartment protein CcmL/EutN [Maledivibacter halophilus]